ncbi:hypothetical protein [Bosea sp. 117]|uniref:hypothetical protein n=1 Tax=Bosea sp. 117 TaxID=1125973 RepID=UPI00049476B8|nr:hypothetical protein [Bosea sp. 117]
MLIPNGSFSRLATPLKAGTLALALVAASVGAASAGPSGGSGGGRSGGHGGFDNPYPTSCTQQVVREGTPGHYHYVTRSVCS